MRSASAVLLGTAILFVLCGLPQVANAQSAKTEHTLKLDDSDSRTPATLEDVAWMVGSWSGTAFGNTFEEVWNPPSAGSMVGMWKLVDGDRVVFYEIMLLVEEEGSLSLKVKHFNSDLTAWEDKEDYVRFRLVKLGNDAVYFSGLSFYRINGDEIHAFIAMHHEGEVREETIFYRRTN